MRGRNVVSLKINNDQRNIRGSARRVENKKEKYSTRRAKGEERQRSRKGEKREEGGRGGKEERIVW